MKKNCLNCHFFSKEHHDESGKILKFSLNDSERETFAEDPIGYDRGWYSLACYMGVWDEGVTKFSTSEDAILFSQDRGYDCFFTPYRQSMLLPAAVEIQKRSEEYIQLQKSSRYTVIGLWIADFGLLLNAILALFKT